MGNLVTEYLFFAFYFFSFISKGLKLKKNKKIFCVTLTNVGFKYFLIMKYPQLKNLINGSQVIKKIGM